ADMENALIEIQRDKDHQRWASESKRSAEKVQTAYDNRIAVARKEAELAKTQEAVVRAQRNRDAAERVAPAQVDQWYAEAEARRHNAFAERQDAAADLARGSAAALDPTQQKDAESQQRSADLAVLDHEIELARARGNEGALLAL